MRSCVGVSLEDWLYEVLVRIDVSEGGYLFSNVCLMHLDHFPAGHDVNTSFVTLVKPDLFGVRHLMVVLVWCLM